jgi:dynein heavy chain
MATMRDVRKRSERTDAMFEPLRDAVSSLASAGMALPDGVLRQLESAEARWRGLKKRVLNRREELAALQQAEAVDVRRKSDAFSERVEDYRK